MFNGDGQQDPQQLSQQLSQQLFQLFHPPEALSQKVLCMQNAFSQPTNNELSFQRMGHEFL
jgi:hypothetical protein